MEKIPLLGGTPLIVERYRSASDERENQIKVREERENERIECTLYVGAQAASRLNSMIMSRNYVSAGCWPCRGRRV